MKEIDLPANELEIVKKLLKQYLPGYEVRAFGSRVTHTAKKFSDLDLVIMTTEPISLTLLADLSDAFSNTSLPIKVDVLDWSRITPDFQAVIQKNNVVIR